MVEGSVGGVTAEILAALGGAEEEEEDVPEECVELIKLVNSRETFFCRFSYCRWYEAEAEEEEEGDEGAEAEVVLMKRSVEWVAVVAIGSVVNLFANQVV